MADHSITSLAAICSSHGDLAKVVETKSLPMPVAKRGEVLVNMLAAPINPSDRLSIQGVYGSGPKAPMVPGFEGVGIVEASGGGWLANSYRGKRVSVVTERAGTWAQYCVASASNVIPVPDELKTEDIASFFINPATALMLTRCLFQVPQHNWIMQSAAGSSLGRMMIRLGRHCKFRTLNVVRRQEQVAELEALGADVVMVADENTDPDKFSREVFQACLAAPPKFAIDAVGGHVGSLLFNSLGEGGQMRVVASLSKQPLQIPSWKTIDRNLRLENFLLNREIERFSGWKKVSFVRTLTQLHRSGVFRVEKFRKFPLKEITAALQASEAAGGGEKVILTM